MMAERCNDVTALVLAVALLWRITQSTFTEHEYALALMHRCVSTVFKSKDAQVKREVDIYGVCICALTCSLIKLYTHTHTHIHLLAAHRTRRRPRRRMGRRRTPRSTDAPQGLPVWHVRSATRGLRLHRAICSTPPSPNRRALMRLARTGPFLLLLPRRTATALLLLFPPPPPLLLRLLRQSASRSWSGRHSCGAASLSICTTCTKRRAGSTWCGRQRGGNLGRATSRK
jgi:hypothetical protein